MHATSALFGLLELPFLLVCIYFAFRTAVALKGGVFGRGMMLLACGFTVMAIGHVHMQIEQSFGVNGFNALLGESIGRIIWVGALLTTWALSGIGFYKIFRASRRTTGA